VAKISLGGVVMHQILSFMKDSFQKWSFSMKRRSYYRQNKGISLFGRILNLFFAELLLFAAGYVWFVQRTKVPTLALILNSAVNGLLITAYILWDRKSYQKKKTTVKKKAAREFLTSRIRQLDPEEFKWQIMRLLLKLEQIGDIKNRAGFLETTFNGKRMAVGYYNAAFGEDVSPQQLASFLNQAKKEGYPEALFASTGKYSEQCSILTEKKSTMTVHLLDMDDLLEIMEKSGMYPDDRTIDAVIDKEIRSRKRKFLIFKKEILTPKRIRTYLGYSLFFVVLSALFQTMSLYYTLVSIAFFMLALLSFIWGMRNPAEPEGSKKFVDTLTPKES
jgi:ABC-type multidrug transport system fused ATPase/permease subunit